MQPASLIYKAIISKIQNTLVAVFTKFNIIFFKIGGVRKIPLPKILVNHLLFIAIRKENVYTKDE